jgi:lysyl-tRNA synthetase class 2
MSIKSEKIEGKFIIVEIDSSNLNSAKYDTENEVLSVTFNSGSIYEYNKVPWSVFTKLRAADSQGKYFNENISRKYNYTKLK